MKKSIPRDIVEKIQYYVYRLEDPRTGQPFYIGKGADQRVLQHEWYALKSEIPSAKFAKIRDGVSEITASGAALVWSCIDEADTRAGGLYWYDPKEYASTIQWSAAEVQDTLRAIADWAAGAGGGH